MTEYAYSPMREPRKEVTEEQMKETLARRVRESVQKHAERVSINGGSGEVSTALPSAGKAPDRHPAAPTPAISWDKPIPTSDDGLGYQRSTCGRFVIAKVRVKDTFQYTASRVNPGSVASALGSFLTLQEAQQCCEGRR